jgi:hypothetical protein
MTYSLNAFNAWEGFHVAFNGTRGRLEHRSVYQLYESVDGGLRNHEVLETKLIPLRGAPTDIEIAEFAGDHVGADGLMLEHIFAGENRPDTLSQAADHRSGAYSVLTGIAANHSLESGDSVTIADLALDIEYPDYTTMPDHSHHIPMPRRV